MHDSDEAQRGLEVIKAEKLAEFFFKEGAPGVKVGRRAEKFLGTIVSADDFVTNRSLKDYLEILGPGLKKSLDKLDSKSHWLDAGAGEAQAQIDFFHAWQLACKTAPSPLLTAVRRYPKNNLNELSPVRFLASDFVKIPESQIGAADLITDLTGVINYSNRPDRVLKKYLSLIKNDGSIYIFLPPLATQIQARDKIFSFHEWLLSIKGFSGDLQKGVLHLKKSDVRIPPLRLERVFQADITFRLFRER